MSCFALKCLNTEDETEACFPVREAASAEDYLISLLLDGQGNRGDNLWVEFLGQVVLRHAPCVDAGSVSVLSYDRDACAILLEDSDPYRQALVDTRKRWHGYGKSAIGFKTMEKDREGHYVVPVSRIMNNLEHAFEDDCVWDLIKTTLPPAPPALLHNFKPEVREVIDVYDPEVIEILDSDDEEEECKTPAKKMKSKST